MITSVDIEDLGSVGVVRDVPPHLLPPEAWSYAFNVRAEEGSVRRLPGWSQIFGTPTVAPYHILYVSSASQPWWLYSSLTKAYVYDGSSHTNITRQTAGVDVNYTATEATDWNSTILGGIPILNSGTDVPQYWASYAAATKLADLTNWPSTLRARVVRSFGSFLFALYCTKSGTAHPHLVKWSHPADPGTVPGSWDETDATVDAGERDLPDVNSGFIVDGLPLRGSFFIYKQGSVWRARFVGGQEIFAFDTLLETEGCLATRCVTVASDGKSHFFATSDVDITRHDGGNSESVLHKRFKRYLFNQIDTSNYTKSFMFTNHLYEEVWFCYPQSGSTVPDRAVIISKEGKIFEADCAYQAATAGIVETSDSETWASTSGTWETDTTPWSTSSRRRVVLASPVASKIFLMDSTQTRDGSAYTSTLRRDALAIVGRKRDGSPIEDYEVRKIWTRIWPKLRNGSVSIRVGAQEKVDGVVTWGATQTFNGSEQDFLDIIANGRAISIEFSATGDFALDGYKLHLSKVGTH